jgi:hypothetical protein
MVAIVITPRPQAKARGDYHAQIENDSRIWGNGWTADEAIGNLVRNHSESFGLQDKAGLIDNADLTYEDVGQLVRRDAEKLGIEIRETATQ